MKNPKELLPEITILRVRLRRKAERQLTAWGIPPRGGRRAERRAHPSTLDRERRETADLQREQVLRNISNRVRRRRGLRPVPPPPPTRQPPGQAKQRRTPMYYNGRTSRVAAVCMCWLCGRWHHQRRPAFQVERDRGLPDGAYMLKPEWPAYCCTEHRMEAWRKENRPHDDGIVCQGPECDEWVPRTPGPGRPSDYHEPRCKQRAYRARVAARRARAAGE